MKLDGYIQAIDYQRLANLAQERDLLLRLFYLLFQRVSGSFVEEF